MWIYGAGGFGRETHDACLAAGIAVDGFLDDGPAGASVRSLPVRRAADVAPASFVVAIADPSIRSRLHRSLGEVGWHAVSVIDPRAVVGTGTTIDDGSVVLPTAFVSCDVRLGAGTHVNYGATIGHDVVCGTAVTVLPGAHVGGAVTLGDGVLVGSGAVILQGRTIGDGAVVGAGAVVTSDVTPGSTVVGVPARPLPS